jgi:hypothetical protein
MAIAVKRRSRTAGRSSWRWRVAFLFRPTYQIEQNAADILEIPMRFLTLLLVLASPILADESNVQRGIPCADTRNECQMLDVCASTSRKAHSAVYFVPDGGFAHIESEVDI